MKRKVFLSTLLIMLFVAVIYKVYLMTLLSVPEGNDFPEKIFACRIAILVGVFAFLMLHIWYGVVKLYEKIHDYRYLLGIALLAAFVLLKLNFSSIGMYDYYVEPGQGSEFCSPIFGQARGIRSDEWLVSTPRMFSGQYSNPAYSDENDIVMARETSNLSSAGFQIGLCMLATPHNWLYVTGDVAYGLSFRWGFLLIFGILFTYEFFLIITKGKRLLSCTGMAMVIFSSMFMWWSYMVLIVYAFAAIDAFFYFVKVNEKFKRVLFALGLVIATASFCAELYPAWQVPIGYFILGNLICIVIDNFDDIKQFRIFEIGTILISLALLIVVLISYIQNNLQYIQDISKTVYPGHRESFGSYVLSELFYYPQTLLYPFRDIINPCEFSVFFSFFPIAFIIGFWHFIKNKHKKDDVLTLALLVISIIYTGFCCFEYPHTLAKILLFTYSTPARLADILGLVQVVLLIHILGKYEPEEMFSPIIAVIVTALAMSTSLRVCLKDFPDYLQKQHIIVIWGSLSIIMVCLLIKYKNNHLRSFACISLTLLIFVSGMYVNPLMRGVNALYTKPIEKKISKIVQADSEGVWVGIDNLAFPSILIANGAPTLDCVNYIPNYELWEQLDPDREYEEIWNRYAHVHVGFTDQETMLSLNTPDSINVNLSYKDICKTDLDYVVCMHKLKSNQWVEFDKIYHKNGIYIYKVSY